ncbi:MAG: 1-acyl-sn-glycerol-3-phosphate acyltransferase [Bacteroidetes bacterium HGW-Bacteroidetes-2]|jgi:1-acyl-sn-glycerol-3-phosphate acyltransferase|nr:MAG: 1-acyl-sn-glycerol-3-phosphate acyltransferase [Bacteroidetes bacterium HGW-Bacteroidetes-2]
MKLLLHILSYPLSAIYYLAFGSVLAIFHPIQWFCLNVFGYQAHKKSVDYMNFFAIGSLRILGTRFDFSVPNNIPKNVPLLIVTNHQSMYDIPPIIWSLRRFHPKFVSKKELGKGIPSVSFNLRHGGSVLIDRKNPAEAVAKMTAFAHYLETNKRSGVIFPEGTRSRTGEPKTFHRKGLQTLINHMPSAYILPITVNNSWKLQRYGMFPIPLGVHLKFTVHPVIKVSDFSAETLLDMLEEKIKSAVRH